jgi:three-Cys-motif partner protein
MAGKTWGIERHTEAKLQILRAYLQAWFPILAQGRQGRVVYIDGFAGPGRYSSGEAGSPIIAIQAVLNQPSLSDARIDFHFIEADSAVATHLRHELAGLEAQLRSRPRLNVRVHDGEFAAIYPQISSSLGSVANPVPTFALIDPFGWAGVPFSITADLLGRPMTEVLFNFMHEEITRFLAHKDQPNNFDALFGTPKWRDFVALTGRRRTRSLHDLYGEQLLKHAKYVRSFTMVNESRRIDYFLFFATQNIKGLERMKEAMWRVDPLGDFCFSDATDPNALTLFGLQPDLSALKRLFRDRASEQLVPIEQLFRWTLIETPFLKKHARSALKDEEDSGRLVIQGCDTRRRHTFPEDRGLKVLLRQ